MSGPRRSWSRPRCSTLLRAGVAGRGDRVVLPLARAAGAAGRARVRPVRRPRAAERRVPPRPTPRWGAGVLGAGPLRAARSSAPAARGPARLPARRPGCSSGRRSPTARARASRRGAAGDRAERPRELASALEPRARSTRSAPPADPGARAGAPGPPAVRRALTGGVRRSWRPTRSSTPVRWPRCSRALDELDGAGRARLGARADRAAGGARAARRRRRERARARCCSPSRSAIRARRFRAVFVCGLQEGEFPHPGRARAVPVRRAPP